MKNLGKRSINSLYLLCLITFVLAGCNAEQAWQWHRAEAGLPRQELTLTVAADPTNADRIWLGAYDIGDLIMTNDGGQSWASLAGKRSDNPIFDLLALPNGHLWAATRDGVCLLYTSPSPRDPE